MVRSERFPARRCRSNERATGRRPACPYLEEVNCSGVQRRSVAGELALAVGQRPLDRAQASAVPLASWLAAMSASRVTSRVTSRVAERNRPVRQPSRWGAGRPRAGRRCPDGRAICWPAGRLTLLGRRPPRAAASWHVGCRRRGHPTPHSGRGGWSPNRNDNSTKRRPAVTSRTSCRCEQLNTSAAPAAGRYSSGPYSGKRS
jgi:hypothetical protein